jgi:hypothetical protein
LEEKRLNHWEIPSFKIWQPKIFNCRWISEPVMPNYKVIINFCPSRAPRRAPNRDLSPTDLIEGIMLKEMNNLEYGGPKS